ncbi:MAG: hypothetical protein NXI21_01685 [Alphaproteobacteria bacterium]|nr:hypothetical protein [Alphaproteobacteria bacterium]
MVFMRNGVVALSVAAIVVFGWALLGEAGAEEAAPPADQPTSRFTKADLYLDSRTRPHADVILRGVNKLAAEDPRCRDAIDPTSAYLSSRSRPGAPVFFVTCGTGAGIANVFFTPEDVTDQRRFSGPNHIARADAMELCEARARQAAQRPSTVKFSRFWDAALHEHGNGRTRIISTFTAQDAFGAEAEFTINCLLDADGLIEATIIGE